MSGLRFAFLTTFYPPFNFGGDGIGIQRLARGLARAGHRVTVIHDADAYRILHRGAMPAPVPEQDGIDVITLWSRAPRLSTLLTQQLGRPVVNGRRIAALLRQGRYDVINFHNTSLVGGPGLFRHGDAIKLYMAHEHWLVCPTHVLWRHRREPCPKRQCLRCQLIHRRPPQLWRATGLLEREGRHIDAFIAMSEFSRTKHEEFGFPFPMDVVPYFLEDGPAPEPEPDARPSPNPRPYFLFVGRLEKIKGLDDVIPLFRNGEPGGADLLIAGDGEHASALRGAAGGSERVRFLGRVPLEELRSYYEHALALIVPSVCFETFGIIIIEAFRQGTPVIARRIGPFPELVETSGGGLLFGSADELRAALRSVEVDPRARARLAARGREAFTGRWREKVVVPRYLDLVRRVAERTGRRELAARLAVATVGSAAPPDAACSELMEGRAS